MMASFEENPALYPPMTAQPQYFGQGIGLNLPIPTQVPTFEASPVLLQAPRLDLGTGIGPVDLGAGMGAGMGGIPPPMFGEAPVLGDGFAPMYMDDQAAMLQPMPTVGPLDGFIFYPEGNQLAEELGRQSEFDLTPVAAAGNEGFVKTRDATTKDITKKKTKPAEYCKWLCGVAG